MNVLESIINNSSICCNICNIKDSDLVLKFIKIYRSYHTINNYHFMINDREIFHIKVIINSHGPKFVLLKISGHQLNFDNLDNLDKFIEKYYPNIY